MQPRRSLVSLLSVLALATTTQAGVVINEIDYDNVGTDTAEWIELYNPDGVPQPLTGLELVLHNGNGCIEYDRIDLDPYTIPANGYILFGDVTTACTVGGFGSSDAIQNGPQDFVYIQDRNSGVIVDLVEYESASLTCSFTTGTATTAADSNTDPNGSIQRCPGGWVYVVNNTICAANNCPQVATERETWGRMKNLFR